MAEPRGEVVLEVRGLRKDYRGLRPLRIEHLQLHERQAVAVMGLDQITAEVLVNLLTGASVPDTGEVRIFGQSTAQIESGDAWLASLDRLGILSERAVLLDQLTVEQNLAVPFTLELDAIPDPVRSQVAQLAIDVGLEREDLSKPVGDATAPARLRLRLARAIALGPRVLLAEHPSAMLAPDDIPAFAADFSKVIAERRLAALVLTADRRFAAAVADEILTLQPATGELKPSSGWRRFF